MPNIFLTLIFLLTLNKSFSTSYTSRNFDEFEQKFNKIPKTKQNLILNILKSSIKRESILSKISSSTKSSFSFMELTRKRENVSNLTQSILTDKKNLTTTLAITTTTEANTTSLSKLGFLYKIFKTIA